MDGVSPILVKSFGKHRGKRGVHFYDSKSCEFLDWSEAMKSIDSKFPGSFANRLVDVLANYDPETEFVTVSAGSGQLTIELFKSHQV